MGYSTVVAGTSITASWANANVRDQVVTPFATTSARSSAVSAPVEGMVSAITDDNRLEVYDGSAYQRFAHYASGGRTGGSWSRASNLSVNNSTLTTITFTTEATDSDGFLTPTSGTVTIPSGLGGIYAYDARWTWSGAPGISGWAILINGSVAKYVQGVSNTTQGCDGVLTLAAADTFAIQVIQNSGGAANLNPASLTFYRLAI